MAPNTDTNIWAQMNYAPPRGQCNYKPSLMSTKCPCLRFMLHPLKSSSTFECDGCSHHASFHNLENKAENEVQKRWEMEQKARETEAEANNTLKSRKRPRQIEAAASTSNGRLLIDEHAFDDDEGSDTVSTITTRSKATTRKNKPTVRGRTLQGQPRLSRGQGVSGRIVLLDDD